MITMDNFVVFAGSLVLRLMSVFVAELWVFGIKFLYSLEVAHQWTFGYGYLPWQWSNGVYSYVYPLSIAALYEALAWLGVDQVVYLVWVPHIFQALLSAFSDYCFYRWNNNSKWCLFLILTSAYWFYTATRITIFTVETCLTIIALRFYPIQNETKNNTYKFLWIVSFLIMIWPLAAVLWIPLCVNHIRNHIRSVGDFIKAYVLIPLIVGTVVVAIDSYAYGRFIVTPFEFFKVIGRLNYNSPWYWYFVTVLPVVLMHTLVPFSLAAGETILQRDIYPDRFIILIAIIFTLVIYSCLPHKDFHYILPLLPLFLFITGDALKRTSLKYKQCRIWFFALSYLFLNVVQAIFLGWIAPSGTINVMTPIEQIAREYSTPDGHRANFLFLMPCHSTPLYSHIHQNVSLRFLTCEPNFSGEKDYMNEEQQFYANPPSWLRSNVPAYPKSASPTHTVLFDSLQPKIDDFLKSFKLIHNFSHLSNMYNTSLIGLMGHNVLLFERVDDTPPSKATGKPDRFSQENEFINTPINWHDGL